MRMRWVMLAVVSFLVSFVRAEVSAQATSPAPSQQTAPDATGADITVTSS
jgi:hypothetical protein